MTAIRVRGVHPVLGAEIDGLEPRIPLDDGTIQQLRAAFDDRGVLVFRDLEIDEEFQRYLVLTLIGLDVPRPDDGTAPRTQYISNTTADGAAPYGRLLFHCDNMFARTPQPAISLYGVVVGQPSAPTDFVSMGAAWDSLPQDLRVRVEGLRARHGFDHRYPNRGGDDDVIDSWFEQSLSCVRPVGFRHPRTGRTLLYVSQQSTIEIVGLPPEENEALLAELFAHLYDRSNVMEHQWAAGDLVVWDNVAVQHGRGTVDLRGPERTLRKITGPLNLDPDELRGLVPVHSKVAK